MMFRLKISAARVTDSGNYTCTPTAAEGASVTVHIINGKCQFSRNLLFIHSRIMSQQKKDSDNKKTN